VRQITHPPPRMGQPRNTSLPILGEIAMMPADCLVPKSECSTLADSTGSAQFLGLLGPENPNKMFDFRTVLN
jgi:hypothetical protein